MAVSGFLLSLPAFLGLARQVLDELFVYDGRPAIDRADGFIVPRVHRDRITSRKRLFQSFIEIFVDLRFFSSRP